MCLSCGCDKPNERHKPGDIIQSDLEKAAKNSDIDIETAAANIHAAAKTLGKTGKGKSA